MCLYMRNISGQAASKAVTQSGQSEKTEESCDNFLSNFCFSLAKVDLTGKYPTLLSQMQCLLTCGSTEGSQISALCCAAAFQVWGGWAVRISMLSLADQLCSNGHRESLQTLMESELLTLRNGGRLQGMQINYVVVSWASRGKNAQKRRKQ